MNRSEFLTYAEETFSVTPDHPFADDTSITVFRHGENRKWFAVGMTVHASRLGLSEDEYLDIVNVKCDPDMKYSFLDGVGIFPAYHMSKRHWITIVLDSRVDEEKIKWLLEVSYDLTGIKRKNAAI